MRDYIMDLLLGKVSLVEVKDYFVGELRYKLFYSKFKWLIRQHIIEQINYRIMVMNPKCYNDGACVKCGCETPALQMASKGCEGNCYPPMVDKRHWETKGTIRAYIDDTKVEHIWIFDHSTRRYFLI